MHRRSKNLGSRSYRVIQLSVLFFLGALLLTAPAIAMSPDEPLHPPGGMVYCPLSKKYQPVRPAAIESPQKTFDEICATHETKNRLGRQIFVENFYRSFLLDKNKLNELVFDLAARGKSAIDKLPMLPNLPTGNLVKQIRSNQAAGSSREIKFVWKQRGESFFFDLRPRPPTAESAIFDALTPTNPANKISRRIAPRAPPVRS